MSINKKLNEDFFETKRKHKQNRSDKKLTTKKVITNLILTFIFIAISNLLYVKCENRIENNIRKDKQKSNFNLEKDYAEFQTKMGELDTLKVWISHSLCTYQGNEKLEITKRDGKIKIKSEYKEGLFEKNKKWKVMYEKEISENDTIWKFGLFLKQNENRTKLENKNENYGRLQIKYKGNIIHFYTKKLSDTNVFMFDYYETMLKIFPENTDNLYWKREKIEIVE